MGIKESLLLRLAIAVRHLVLSAMSARIGFDVVVTDQKKRMDKQQEQVNRNVMSKYVRILFVPNPERQALREVVKRFLSEIVRYENTSDGCPLGWVKPTGGSGDTTCFRAEMSSLFWDYYLEKGKRNLMEYNRRQNANVKLIRDHTIKVGDVENLSLYMRKRIRQYCLENQLSSPEITVKNGYLTIKSMQMSEPCKFKSTILAIKLGWEYSDWSGLPIKELLTEHELKEYEDGKLEWGSLTIESLIKIDKSNSSSSVVNDVRHNRKREASSKEILPSKLPRNERNQIEIKE